MNEIKKYLYLSIFALATILVSGSANAQLSIFTEHQLVHMVEHRVYNPYAPTGDYPYIGRIGLEYDFKKISYSIGYIHRSNLDITDRNEYNYDGISIGVKYKHCIIKCD